MASFVRPAQSTLTGSSQRLRLVMNDAQKLDEHKGYQFGVWMVLWVFGGFSRIRMGEGLGETGVGSRGRGSGLGAWSQQDGTLGLCSAFLSRGFVQLGLRKYE
ncbi:MAG: hypothetical protein RI897_4060 [Verrucomicrobiota bacterium]|jgi:hypothetical protein